jgi:hypothetical protein
MTRAAMALILVTGIGSAMAQSPKEMSFFVTSVGTGNGGDLGGLQGADKHCQSLAEAAGAGGRTWRAYLSTSGPGAVNARDRIGKGPWKNAIGVVIAESVEQLHGENAINQETALNEKGLQVPGRRSGRNSMHDILTGSTRQGRAFPADRDDRTCNNWTTSGDGVAMVGHHDRIGTSDDEDNRSWNSSHRSRGCDRNALSRTGGDGLFYCFATD